MCFYKQINQAHKVPDESPWQEEQNHWRQRTQEDVIIFLYSAFFLSYLFIHSTIIRFNLFQSLSQL